MTGRAIVLRGDARNLPLPDASVDLVVTSPPYFALRSYTDGGSHYDGQIGSEATPAQWVANLLDCTREWMRVLKPTGSIFVNLGDKYSMGQRLDNEFTYEDAAWLGGVIDSDGSISIPVRKDKSSPQHGLAVDVGQKYRNVVDRIAQVIGFGTVSLDNSRGLWRWRVQGQRAAWVLERIWPWLYIKRRQALAAVELIRSRQGYGRTGGSRTQLTEDELRYRERIREAIMAWNAGEPDDYEPQPLPSPGLPRRARWVPAKSLFGLPWRYALACTDELGLFLRSEIIWHKLNGLPESVTDRVRRSHEQVFHFTKQPRYFTAVDEIREPQNGNTHARRKDGAPPPKNAAGLAADVRKGYFAETTFNPLGKLPGSVWDIASQPLTVPAELGVVHFAAFPMELPRRIILGWSPSGICVECGEGRRPVATGALEAINATTNGKSRAREADDPSVRTQRTALVARKLTTITGYACACPEPTAPTRPAVVLDPFGGTGTTALVASVYGRVGISVDRSADYCRLAAWRTTDPGQRAAAMQVERPEPIHDDQLALEFEVA